MPKGRFVFAQTLVASDSDFRKVAMRKISLYSRRQRTYVIKITRDRYKRVCEGARARIKHEKLEFLKSVELFNKFSRNSVKNLVKSLVLRSLKRGEYLYKEGESADKVFFIIDG